MPFKIKLMDSQSAAMRVRFGDVQRVSTDDYDKLYNKPKINSVELVGDKSSFELKLQGFMNEVTPQDIDDIIYGR